MEHRIWENGRDSGRCLRVGDWPEGADYDEGHRAQGFNYSTVMGAPDDPSSFTLTIWWTGGRGGYPALLDVWDEDGQIIVFAVESEEHMLSAMHALYPLVMIGLAGNANLLLSAIWGDVSNSEIGSQADRARSERDRRLRLARGGRSGGEE